ncbi:metallophosphoesterase [Adhaeribacter terreus]|uniref:Metallophosphoesterase n=1 Tax=Adhaeribacter terreus TaxID=529703 RepID=A0ABW0E9Z0_9BACT
MLTEILLIIICLLLILFAYAFWREWQYRHRPYYRKTVLDWAEKVPPASKPVYSVVLIGDTGNVATDGSDAVLNLLQRWLKTSGQNSRVIFLGDNIYPKGIPPATDRHRESAEEKMLAQLRIFKNYAGKVTFLSGNHDWNKGRENGYSFVLRQEEFVRSYLPDEEVYLPQNGCPGPVSIQMAPGLLLIVLNTQWWVQKGIRPIGVQYGCPQESSEEILADLVKILRHNQHQRILIAAHHPLYSNSVHGGKFTVKQHLFPLTAAHKKFYIPMPGFGSLYPVYRKFIGAEEDMSHPRYKRLRRKLLRIFKEYNNIIYAAGHDHNLQYFHMYGNHFIVSGAGSKTTFVKKGGKATFTHECKGFFVIDYYEDETWLRILEPGPDKETVEIFRIKL